MVFGVLQRLTIIEQSACRLTLRELPLMEWVIVAVLLIIGINLALLNLWITAAASVLVALLIIAQARVRYISFDADEDTLEIYFQSLLQHKQVSAYRLKDITRAYLKKDEREYSQIILLATNGDEMGLSVYSRDVSDWKSEIVLAINTLLHEAHRDEPDGESKV